MIKYTPITELTSIKLPDGTLLYKEVPLNGFDLGSLGMKDPNRGKKVGAAVGTAGGIVAEVPLPPWAQVVGAVIIACGALITAFSNTKKTQRDNAAAAGYEEANRELQNQNLQLDAKIKELQTAIINAKKSFGLDPNVSLTGDGLGWCLVNCAKNDAKKRLASAKGLYDQLTQSQEDKIDVIQKLTDEAQRLFTKQTKTNYAYIGVGLLVLTALGIYASK
jgi:hypothetical protein